MIRHATVVDQTQRGELASGAFEDGASASRDVVEIEVVQHGRASIARRAHVELYRVDPEIETGWNAAIVFSGAFDITPRWATIRNVK